MLTRTDGPHICPAALNGMPRKCHAEITMILCPLPLVRQRSGEIEFSIRGTAAHPSVASEDDALESWNQLRESEECDGRMF